MELLKAQALLQYWTRQQEIADAVYDYAQDESSDKPTADDTRTTLAASRAVYNAAVQTYTDELQELQTLLGQVDTAQTAIETARNLLDQAEAELKQAKKKYQDAMDAMLVSNVSFYKRLLRSNYRDLLVELGFNVDIEDDDEEAELNETRTEADLYEQYMLAAGPYLQGTLVSETARELEKQVFGEATNGYLSMANLKGMNGQFDSWSMPDTADEEFMQDFEFLNGLDGMNLGAYYNAIETVYEDYSEEETKTDPDEDVILLCRQKILNYMEMAGKQIQAKLDQRIAAITLLSSSDFGDWLDSFGLDVSETGTFDQYSDELDDLSDQAATDWFKERALYELAIAQKVREMLESGTIEFVYATYDVSTFNEFNALSSEVKLNLAAYDYIITIPGYGGADEETVLDEQAEIIDKIITSLTAISEYLTGMVGTLEDNSAAIKLLSAEDYYWKQFLDGVSLLGNGTNGLENLFYNGTRDEQEQLDLLASTISSLGETSPVLKQYFHDKQMDAYEDALVEYGLGAVETIVDDDGVSVTNFVFANASAVWAGQFGDIAGNSITAAQVEEIYEWYSGVSQELKKNSVGLEYLDEQTDRYLQTLSEFLALQINRRQNDAARAGLDAYNEGLSALQQERRDTQLLAVALQNGTNPDLKILCELYEYGQGHENWSDLIGEAEIETALVDETGIKLAKRIILETDYINLTPAQYADMLGEVFDGYGLYDFDYSAIETDVVETARELVEKATALHNPEAAFEEGYSYWPALYELAFLKTEPVSSSLVMAGAHAGLMYAFELAWQAQAAFTGALAADNLSLIQTSLEAALAGKMEEEEIDIIVGQLLDVMTEADSEADTPGKAARQEALGIFLARYDDTLLLDDEIFAHVPDSMKDMYREVIYLGLCKGLSEYTADDTQANKTAAFLMDLLGGTAYADVYDEFAVLEEDDEWGYVFSLDERLFVNFLQNEILAGNDINDELDSLSPANRAALEELIARKTVLDGYMGYFDGSWLEYLLENYDYENADDLTRMLAINSEQGTGFFAPTLEMPLTAAIDMLQYDHNLSAFRALSLQQLNSCNERLQDELTGLYGYYAVLADQADFYGMQADGCQSYRAVLGGSNPDPNETEPAGYLELASYSDQDYDYDNQSDALAAGTLAADESNIAHVESGDWYDNMLLERYNELARHAEMLAMAKSGADTEDYSAVFSEYFVQANGLETLNDPASDAWAGVAGYEDKLETIVQSIYREEFTLVKSAYVKAQREWGEKIAKIHSLKSTIMDLGEALANSMLSNEELTAKISEARDELYGSADGTVTGCQKLYEQALADWQTAINACTLLIDGRSESEEGPAVTGYNQLHETVSGLYGAMEAARLEFEKADAVFAYASSGYLLTPAQEEEESTGAPPDGSVDAGGVIDELTDPPAVDPASRKAWVDGEKTRAEAIFDALYTLFTDENGNSDTYAGPAPLYSGEDDSDDPLVISYRENYDTYREYYLRTLLLQEIRTVTSEALVEQQARVSEAASDAMKEIGSLIRLPSEKEGEVLPDYEYSGGTFPDDENYDSRWYWMLDMQKYLDESNTYTSVNELLEAFGMVYSAEQEKADRPWEQSGWMNEVLGKYSSKFPEDKRISHYRSRALALAQAGRDDFYAKNPDGSLGNRLYQYFKQCMEQGDNGLINIETSSGKTFITAAVEPLLIPEMVSDLNKYQKELRDEAGTFWIIAGSILIIVFDPVTAAVAALYAADCDAKANDINDVKAVLNTLKISEYIAESEEYFISNHSTSGEAIRKYQQEAAVLAQIGTGEADGNVTLADLAASISASFDLVGRASDLDNMMEKACGSGGTTGLISFLKMGYAGLTDTESAAIDENAETAWTSTDALLQDIYLDTESTGENACLEYSEAEQEMAYAYNRLYNDYLEAQADVFESEEPTAEQLAAFSTAAEKLFSMSYSPKQAAILKYELYAGISETLGTENLDNQTEVLKGLVSAQWNTLLQMNAHKDSQYARVRTNEFQLVQKDYEEKQRSWNDKISAILWRGRTAWRKAGEELQKQNGEWVEDFIGNYQDKQEEWDLRYLDILTAKDAWVGEVSLKAAQIGSARVLNDVGISADLAIGGVDGFVISGVDAEKPVARNLFESVVDMDMMNGLIQALEDSNGIIDTVQTRIFANLKIESEASILQKIAEYQARDREEIEKHTLIMMAEKALDSMKLAEEGLRLQIDMANQNFDRQMDAMFINAGFTEKSPTVYQIKIIVGDTVLGGTEYETYEVAQYVPFPVEDSFIYPARISQESLEGLSARGIEAFVDQVSRFYQDQMDLIFDSETDKTATDQRMETFINSLNGKKARKTEDGKWMFIGNEGFTLFPTSRTLRNDGLSFETGDGMDYAAMLDNYMAILEDRRADFMASVEEQNERREEPTYYCYTAESYMDVLNYLFRDENGEGLLADGKMDVKNGLFYKYIGYAPRFYDDADPDKPIKSNVMIEGSGQLNVLMKDFQRVMFKEQKGLSEYNAPVWAKPLWDTSKLGLPDWIPDFIVEPSLQDIIGQGFTVAGCVVSAFFGPYAGALVSLTDDLIFMGLNVGGGYQTLEDGLEDLGKKAIIAIAMAGIGDKFQGIAEGLGKAVDTVTEISLAVTEQLTGNLVSGLVNSIDIDFVDMFTDLFDGDGKFGENGSYVHFNAEGFMNSVFGLDALAGYLASSAGILTRHLVSDAILSDKNAVWIQELNLDKDDFKSISVFSSVLGSLTGEAMRYMVSGQACFNILNFRDIAQALGLSWFKNKDGKWLSAGLVEMRISRDNGIQLALGGNGADVSVSTMIEFAHGLSDSVNIAGKIMDYERKKAELERLAKANAVTSSNSKNESGDKPKTDEQIRMEANTKKENERIEKLIKEAEIKASRETDPQKKKTAWMDAFRKELGVDDFEKAVNFLKEYYRNDPEGAYHFEKHLQKYLADGEMTPDDFAQMKDELKSLARAADYFQFALYDGLFNKTDEQLREEIKNHSGLLMEAYTTELEELVSDGVVSANEKYNIFENINVDANESAMVQINAIMYKDDLTAHSKMFKFDGYMYILDEQESVNRTADTKAYMVYQIKIGEGETPEFNAEESRWMFDKNGRGVRKMAYSDQYFDDGTGKYIQNGITYTFDDVRKSFYFAKQWEDINSAKNKGLYEFEKTKQAIQKAPDDYRKLLENGLTMSDELIDLQKESLDMRINDKFAAERARVLGLKGFGITSYATSQMDIALNKYVESVTYCNFGEYEKRLIYLMHNNGSYDDQKDDMIKIRNWEIKSVTGAGIIQTNPVLAAFYAKASGYSFSYQKASTGGISHISQIAGIDINSAGYHNWLFIFHNVGENTTMKANLFQAWGMYSTAEFIRKVDFYIMMPGLY
ncbi:MAG: hypothetical protein JW874_01045 [Spirochaetales bacterium]|nr:hypothetical protein [Spirochaetales bacterium]